MRTLRAAIALLLTLGLGVPALAQQTLLQGGTFTAGHVPMYLQGGTTQPVVGDSGTAAGGGSGVGLKELVLAARSTGTAPYANAGSGPLSTNFCNYDGPTTAAGGYHYLCLSPNAQGGGLIAYGAGGAASALPLQVSLNGTLYEFPFVLSGTGILGPVSTVASDIMTWGNTSGTLAADSGVKLTATAVLHETILGTGTPTSLITTNTTAFGYHALTSAGASLGIDEVAFGAFALEHDTAGTENTAVGDHALSVCSTCIGNTAMGSSALSGAFTNGQYNTAIGISAMEDTSGGPSQNTAIGQSALQNLQDSGSFNTAVGVQSGFNISTGQYNVALGFQPLLALTTGSGNIGIGRLAGQAGATGIITGSNNVLIGSSASADVDATDSIALGAGANISASHQANIGAATITTTNINGTVTLAKNSTVNLVVGGNTTGNPAVIHSAGETNAPLLVASNGTGTLYLARAGGSTILGQLDSSGNVLFGSTSPVDGGSTARFNFASTAQPFMDQAIFAANNQSVNFRGLKSRGTTVGTQGALSSGDLVLQLTGQGSDGTSFQSVANISYKVPAAVSAGIVPGAITFSTTNVSGVLTSAAYIDQAQRFFVNTISDNGSGAQFQVNGYASANRFFAGATAGVSCSGSPTSSFASVYGIVTHC